MSRHNRSNRKVQAKKKEPKKLKGSKKLKKNRKGEKNMDIQNTAKAAVKAVTGKTEVKSTTAVGTYVPQRYKPCHEVTEITSGLFLGALSQVREMITKFNVDVLVPLDSLDGYIWGLGFRGTIEYCPIKDYGILPYDVYEGLCKKIVAYIKDGKKVGLFCLGGHGRTGYVAAGVLGLLGEVFDPVGVLWDKYCEKSIESIEQLEEIAKISDKSWLVDTYKSSMAKNELKNLYGDWFGSYGYGSYGGVYGSSSYGDYEYVNGAYVKKPSKSLSQIVDDEDEDDDGFDDLEGLEERPKSHWIDDGMGGLIEYFDDEDDPDDVMAYYKQQQRDYNKWLEENAQPKVASSVHDVHRQGDINDPFGFDDGMKPPYAD